MAEAILGVVRRLPERPSWGNLLGALPTELGVHYARSTLCGHPAIALAMADRRAGRGARGTKRGLSARAEADAKVLASVRAECDRLRVQVDGVLEKHVRWAYNAHLHGIGEEELDRELPPINRV